MTSLAYAEAAAERPLALRRRADLQAESQWFGGARHWAVKDPLALRYVHLADEEYAVLSLVDGAASLEQIRQACNERFAPRRFTHAELQGLVASLHRQGLVISDAAGQGDEMLE